MRSFWTVSDPFEDFLCTKRKQSLAYDNMQIRPILFNQSTVLASSRCKVFVCRSAVILTLWNFLRQTQPPPLSLSLSPSHSPPSDGLLQNDTLCVYGDLCLWSESFRNSSSVTRLSPDILVPPCDLAHDLKSLWQDPEATHADITLKTEQKSFLAHK